MPNLRNGSKGGFEPGLTLLRVRHSTTELPRLCGISNVHDALYIYLPQHSLPFSAQSGFRPGHSCETVLLRMIDMWAAAIDRGDINGVILMDFRKVFDLINHECLLKKLNI